MLGGYMGKLLFVDLTQGSVREESLPESVCRHFIGGTGLGIRLLYEHMKPEADPFGPDNMLGFVTGPLTGTSVPSSGRYMVVTKSPLTGAWADSNSGGSFGPELKAAGYDGVFFSGVAPKPVYLWLSPEKAELRDASHLWGKDTTETEDVLRQELNEPGVRIACIGPSGESRTLIAGIIAERGRAAGRGGVGAVMGSKRLKAVAVMGDKKVPVANPENLGSLREDVVKSFQTSEFQKGLHALGTGGGTSMLISMGESALKNWSLYGKEAMPSCTNLDTANLEKYKVRSYACQGCPLACGAILTLKEGPFAVGEVHRPEYETLAAFGSLCLNDSAESVIKANDICNRYGMDTISAGSTIAFAMECYERGIISEKETDGIKLTWGNTEAIVAVLEKMVRRDGFGAVLADGVAKAAERIGKGSEEWAIHVHGREVPMHDTRNWPARAAGYIVDAEASNHSFSDGAMMLELGVPLGFDLALQAPQVDLHGDYENKGPMYKMGFEFFELLSSAGLCSLTMIFNPVTPVAEYITAVTGWDFTWAEALNAGHRILTLRQAFNVREGLLPEEFTLPQRVVEPAATGPNTGVKVDVDALKSHCFAALGWDLKTGIPYQRTLINLGLGELTGDLGEKTKKVRN
jgi:aldehyde:ferredoxin oxidoreductase